MPDLQTIVNVALIVASAVHTVSKWFERRSAKQSAVERRARQVSQVARAVYDAAEATGRLKGIKGEEKWKIAKEYLPKAAKAAGLGDVPSDDLIDDVKTIVDLIAAAKK